MQTPKPDYTYEQLIEAIKQMREHIWDFADENGYKNIKGNIHPELARAIKLANDAIDPNFLEN